MKKVLYIDFGIGTLRANIIALYNTDEHIEKHFGSETELLQVINGYLDLLDRLEVSQ